VKPVVFVAVLFLLLACRKSPPPSELTPGSVPVEQFVSASGDGGLTTRSVSLVLDQHPGGAVLAVSATQITRHGTPARFAQPNVACPNQIIGDCVITNCTSLKDVSSYPYGTVTPRSVGSLTVKGAAHVETFESDGGTRPRVVQSPRPLFSGGEVLEIVAVRDETPPFRRALVVPRAVALLSPVIDVAGGTLPVNREVPFEVKWSPLPKDAAERVAISISDNVRSATCRFDASLGRAVIPKEVMAQLAPGPGFLSVHTLWVRGEVSEGWLVSLFARHVAMQADGGTAHFPTLDIE